MDDTHEGVGAEVRLCDLIEGCGPEILARWEAAVRRLRPAHAMSERALRDHLPQLLERIVKVVRTVHEGGTASLEGFPEAHALERLDQGFDLEAIATEFAILRSTILEVWQREVGPHLRIEEVERLNQAIDTAIVVSVERFAAAQERTLRALDRISAAALGTGDVATFLPRLIKVLQQTDEAVDAVVVLLREGGRLHVRAAVGFVDASVFENASAESFVGKFASDGQPAVLRINGARAGDLEQETAMRNGIRVFYGVPLIHEDSVRGVALMGSRTASDFSEADKQLFRAMAQRATSLIAQSELVQRERAARAEAQRALALVDTLLAASPVGIAFLDKELRYIRINGSLAAANGKPVQAHLGRSVAEVLPESAAALEPVLRKVLETGQPVSNAEVIAPSPSRPGEHRSFLANYYPVRTETGDVLGLGGAVVEITERVRAEERLQRSEARLRRLVEANIVGILFWTVSGGVTDANDAFLKMVGYTREDLLAGRLDWRRLTPPEYRESDDVHVQLLRETGRHPPYEKEYIHKDGHRVPIVVASATFSDAPEHGVAFVLDLTRQRAVEETLRRRERELSRLFGIVPDMVCVAGADGYFKRINAAFTTVLGYSEEELLSRPFVELVHPDDLPEVRAEMQKLARGEPSIRFESRFVRKDGQYRWLSWSASPDAETGTIVASARDITEEKRRSEFEQQLVGIVSHDLRNPLSAILLAASTLARRGEELDPRVLRSIGRIQASAERAVRLIRDLLDFTQARIGGGIPIKVQPVDFDALVRQVVDEIRPSFRERDVRVEVGGVGEGLWDPDRIAQVISNLLINALKYSPADTRVTVRTSVRGPEVLLEVHNTGTPIARELLPFLFEPLRRGQAGEQAGSHGLGLGLYIVDQIVRGHGGTVEVRSTSAEGTTFSVRLPHRPAGGVGTRAGPDTAA